MYSFCKGDKEPNRALVTKPTTNNKLKVLLYTIGVNHSKQRVISRLKITEPGSGYYHFPADREKEYFSQLLAEKYITKTRPRNEAFDLAMYNLAALYISGANLDQLAEEVKQPTPPPPKEEKRASERWIPKKEGWLRR